MKLLIDIGNTRTKWIVADGREFVSRGAALNAEFSSSDLHLPDAISSIWASCVGGDDRFEQVAKNIQLKLNLKVNRIRVEKERAGMQNAYRALDRLGVDRWVAAIGARDVLPQGALIVIDAGTAVTIDVVSNANSFEGGVILPGSVMMHDALVGRTAGISSALSEVGSIIGKSTEECVNAGALYGLAGAIERVVVEIQDGLSMAHSAVQSGSATVLMCGGDADKLVSLLPASYQLEPDIIFRGLRVISEQSE